VVEAGVAQQHAAHEVHVLAEQLPALVGRRDIRRPCVAQEVIACVCRRGARVAECALDRIELVEAVPYVVEEVLLDRRLLEDEQPRRFLLLETRLRRVRCILERAEHGADVLLQRDRLVLDALTHGRQRVGDRLDEPPHHVVAASREGVAVARGLEVGQRPLDRRETAPQHAEPSL
jgi:hypothetical protein